MTIGEKLMKNNYPLWQAQVLLVVRAVQLEGLLTGDESAPDEFITMTSPPPSRSILPILHGRPEISQFIGICCPHLHGRQ
jgi:hypothetical protein